MTDSYIRIEDSYCFLPIARTDHDLGIPTPLQFGVLSSKDLQARQCVRSFVKNHMKGRIWSLSMSPQNPWTFFDVSDEGRFNKWWEGCTSLAPGTCATSTLVSIQSGNILVGLAFVSISSRGDRMDMCVSPLPLMDNYRGRVIAGVASWIFHHPLLQVEKATIRAPINSNASLHALQAGFRISEVLGGKHAILTKDAE